MIGLDIGTYTIKVVQAEKSGDKFSIVKAGFVPNPIGRFLPTDEQTQEQFLSALGGLFKDLKISKTNVRVGFPESNISTKIVSMPPLTDAELASAVNWQAEQYIPIPADQLQLEYQVLYRPPKNNLSEQMRVLLIGVVKDTMKSYGSLLFDAGFEVGAIETNTLALYRATSADIGDQTTLVINLGASTVDMFVVHHGELAFVYSYPNGGTALSLALQRGLGLDPVQAEEYKRTYGLLSDQLEAKVQQAMMPVFRLLLSEIQKAIQFFSSSANGAPVQRMLICGGSAALPNLIPTLAQHIPIETTLYSPFNQTPLAKDVQLNPLDAHAFGIAVGLAMG